MEDVKKRKLIETGNGPFSSLLSGEQLRILLDPLRKDQMIDLLVTLGSRYPSVAEEIKSVASADPVHRKLFVRGLAGDTSSETLCAAFRIHGEIEEGAVVFDKMTGKSRGFGFITYKHIESTQSALRAPSKLINGRMAVCNLACEGLSSASITPDQVQRKLFIGGLSPEITTEVLLNFFGRHGDIEEGSVAFDKDTNKSRGFGFVTYKTVESVKKAIDDPDKILGGRNLTVRLADMQKGKVVQTQLPPAIVPIAMPMPPGYTQPRTTHVVNTTPVGYSAYPQAVATYPQTVATYPQSVATHPQSVATYPQAGSTYPHAGATYPQAVATHPQSVATYPQAVATHPQSVATYPQAVATHPQSVATYPQSGATYPQAVPTYPQAVPTYPSAYPSPAIGVAPYPPQPQISYTHVPVKKDPVGLPASTPAGLGGVPYYSLQ